MDYVEDNKSLLKAFLIAPVVPIGVLSLLYLPLGFIFLIVGLPVAYVGALFIGFPIYYVFRKVGLFGWPSYILGGMVCAMPALALFNKGDVPIVYSLQSAVSYSLLGMSGGFIFWFIHFKRRNVASTPKELFAGIFVLSIAVPTLIYAYVMGKYEYIDGNIVTEQHPFVSSENSQIEIEVNGEILLARLPKGVPFRKNCKIGVVTWRELFSHRRVYSVSHYPDKPMAHQYQWLSKSAQSEINEECN
jgi:hypothetical protein